MDLINYKSNIGNPTFNGNIKMKICRLVVFPIAKFDNLGARVLQRGPSVEIYGISGYGDSRQK
jgi:hypothetical protein